MTQLLTQAGLASAGFFVITVLAGELAGRLSAREEITARGNMEMARQQARAEPPGDRGDGTACWWSTGAAACARPTWPAVCSRPRAWPAGAVPAARRRGSSWCATVERAFAESSWPEAGATCRSRSSRAPPHAARALFHAPARRQASEEFCVLFLEDVRNMQARSRQEKLAAMGRCRPASRTRSATRWRPSRRPTRLLAEDTSDPAQRA